MATRDTSTIVLFDVDGTLTAPRLLIEPKMTQFITELRKKVVIGIVGGSDLPKIREQMGKEGGDVTERFDYVFSENGLVGYKDGQLVEEGNIAKHIGEEKLQTFINFALLKMSQLKLPCKRGTFVEFRKGLINICPVGRSCTQAERDQFAVYDQEHKIREKLVEEFKKEFSDMGLKFVIGGQISIDVFPEGWDKRYALRLVEQGGFKTIYFFGDKTAPGGNDHEIYNDPRTLGHTVTCPDDTRQQVEKLILKKA